MPIAGYVPSGSSITLETCSSLGASLVEGRLVRRYRRIAAQPDLRPHPDVIGVETLRRGVGADTAAWTIPAG